MLPKLPFTLILYLVNIIVGNPVRIILEDRRTQILLLEFIIGVDDRLSMILILYYMQPGKHITLEILHTLICRLMFNIQYRRQISICKMNLVKEIISLFACRRLIAPEMINTPDETEIASLIEVLAEILIQPRRTFRTLDDDEAHRTTLNHRILELLPVYLALIMGNIDSVNLVTFRIFSISIKRTPTETCWTHKEMIEQKDIEHDNGRSAYPPCPTGIAL